MGVIRVEFSENNSADDNAENVNQPSESDLFRTDRNVRIEPKRATNPKRVKIRKKIRASPTPSDVIARSLRRKRPGFQQHHSLPPTTVTIQRFLSEFLAADPHLKPKLNHQDPAAPPERIFPSPDDHWADNTTDREVFWDTWTSQQDRLFKLSMKLLAGNVSDAEDALGVAMVNGCKAFSSAKIENPSAWLSRMVHNACIDVHRRRTRHATPTETDELERLADRAPSATPQTEDPESLLIGRQSAEQLIADLHKLPTSLLEPLLMRCLADMSYEQISGSMKLNNATVRKRVELARKRLREMK